MALNLAQKVWMRPPASTPSDSSEKWTHRTHLTIWTLPECCHAVRPLSVLDFGRRAGRNPELFPSGWAGAEYTMRYTRSVAKTVPVREFRAHLSTLLSDVADRRDHVLVTRNGKPAAALVPIDEYDALEETAEILSDSETLAAIEAGLSELSRGEVVSLADLRAELDELRSTR